MALTINTKIVNDADGYLLDAKNVKGSYITVATADELETLLEYDLTVIPGTRVYVKETELLYECVAVGTARTWKQVQLFFEGYYVQEYDAFYYEETHTNLIVKSPLRIYIDVPTKKIYYVKDGTYAELIEIPSAKLYSTTGQNTDGAMTQKAVTDELAKKVEIEDDAAKECIIFKTGLTA